MIPFISFFLGESTSGFHIVLMQIGFLTNQRCDLLQPQISAALTLSGSIKGIQSAQRGLMSKAISSNSRTSGPYCTCRSPEDGGTKLRLYGQENWDKQCVNTPSVSTDTPKRGVQVFPTSSGQTSTLVVNSLSSTSTSVPSPPQPRENSMITRRGKTKEKLKGKDKESGSKLLENVLSCICECFLCGEGAVRPSNTRGFSEETHKKAEPPTCTRQLSQELYPNKMSNTEYETTSRQPSQRYINKTNENCCNQYSNLPPELYGTMKKDKKPFTYTPGGINLLEIKSPRMAKRIIANQQDPGVAVRPEAQRGPSAAVIQAEIHASENRVYSQPIVTRQLLLPATINYGIQAPGNSVSPQSVATRQPVLPEMIKYGIQTPGNSVCPQPIVTRQPVLPATIDYGIQAPGNSVRPQSVATQQPVLPEMINYGIQAPGNSVRPQSVATRQPVLPGMINQHSVSLSPTYSKSPKVTQKRNADLCSSEKTRDFYLGTNEKEPKRFKQLQQYYSKLLPQNHDIYYEPRSLTQPCFLCVSQNLTSTEEMEDKNGKMFSIF
ncbi:uncharacterized protein LOC143254398 [Tachypleus tridentatus]|uniref:uncharacterized protein LOC143254398 n=1 Tax=Tachypleus tridentatus TaxID=6853 RepID=UPI003FD0E4B4